MIIVPKEKVGNDTVGEMVVGMRMEGKERGVGVGVGVGGESELVLFTRTLFYALHESGASCLP